MDGFNFTERSRRVLTYAREEASRLATPFVDADHILLGLIREREGVCGLVLEMLTGDLDAFARELEDAIRQGQSPSHVGPDPDLPYTSRAKRVLEHSMVTAREMRHSYVGTEHLLLGVLRDGGSAGATLLAARKVTFDGAVAAVERVLGNGSSDQPVRAGPHVRSAEIALDMSDGTTRNQRFTSVEGAFRFLAVHWLR